MEHELIGKIVLAVDEWYGAYIGTCVNRHRTLSGSIRLNVKIVSCIQEPSDRSVFYPQVKFHRKPYETGSVRHFAAEHVMEATPDMLDVG